MEISKIKARITFFEELLGTCSGNKELHREFIASKAPDAESMEEEVAAIGVGGMMEKSMTVFPRDENGQPFLYDYQIKGFFKDSCGVLLNGLALLLLGGLDFFHQRQTLLMQRQNTFLRGQNNSLLSFWHTKSTPCKRIVRFARLHLQW